MRQGPNQRRRVEWTVPSFARSMVAIAAAVLLGLLIDQSFDRLFQDRSVALRLLLQFGVIVAVVALIEELMPRLLPIDLVSNVFFITMFVGVQQHLFGELWRLRLLPWPPHLAAARHT